MCLLKFLRNIFNSAPVILQESCPPFDIHEYGDRILDKLSLEAYSGDVMSFGDVVKGQEKYDVARSFSALLQLVRIPIQQEIKKNVTPLSTETSAWCAWYTFEEIVSS